VDKNTQAHKTPDPAGSGRELTGLLEPLGLKDDRYRALKQCNAHYEVVTLVLDNIALYTRQRSVCNFHSVADAKEFMGSDWQETFQQETKRFDLVLVDGKWCFPVTDDVQDSRNSENWKSVVDVKAAEKVSRKDWFVGGARVPAGAVAWAPCFKTASGERLRNDSLPVRLSPQSEPMKRLRPNCVLHHANSVRKVGDLPAETGQAGSHERERKLPPFFR